MTVRQQIVEDLTRRLLLIAPGYQFTLPDGPYACGNTIREVRPWRGNPYAIHELTAIKLLDALTEVSYPEFNRPLYSVRIGLAAYMAGNTVASRARSVLQDMLAAAGSSPRCGGLARWMSIDRASLALQVKGDVVGAARLQLTVGYHPRPGTEEDRSGLINEDTWQKLFNEDTGQKVYGETPT